MQSGSQIVVMIIMNTNDRTEYWTQMTTHCTSDYTTEGIIVLDGTNGYFIVINCRNKETIATRNQIQVIFIN